MFTWMKDLAQKLSIAIGVLASAHVAVANSFETMCGEAATISSNGSVQAVGYRDTAYFNIDTAAPGILVVDVITFDPSADIPRLIFLGRGCSETGAAEDLMTVDQGTSYQVVAVRSPGTYSLQLLSSGVGQPLGEYELRSSFIPAEIVEKEFSLDLRPGRRMVARQSRFFVDQTPMKSEIEIVDPNPDGLGSPVEFGLKSEIEIVDPNPDGLVSSGRSPFLSLVTVYAAGSLVANLALFPDDHRGAGRGVVREHHETRAALLQLLAGML